MFGYENSIRVIEESCSLVVINNNSKQACYTFKFHPEIKILLKLGCQQTTCITNKTRGAIKKKNISLSIFTSDIFFY
jgi:hypothetical protein